MLDTNIISDLIRNPQGRAAKWIAKVGEGNICTSIIVAAELRYGCAKSGSKRLLKAVEDLLGEINVLPFDVPADAEYLVSGCGPLGRAGSRRFLRWRKEQVGRNMETGAQPLHHRHAQPLLAPKDLADAARCSQNRHHVGAGKPVLIHEMADEIRHARRPARPFALLIGCDQTRLCLEASDVGGLIRLPESVNECAGASEFRIAINQDQGCIHHTVSASILSYSPWVPKNRIATAPARY